MWEKVYIFEIGGRKYSTRKIIEFFGGLYIVSPFFNVNTFFIINSSNNLRNIFKGGYLCS